MAKPLKSELENMPWAGETEAIDDSRPISQGDILRWEVPEHPWRTFGVAVTADCDIAEQKHGGVLSYVPIVQLQDYWQVITLPKQIEDYLSSKFQKMLFERIRGAARAYRPEFSADLSDTALLDMTATSPAAAIVETLRVPERDRPAFVRQLLAFRAARSELGGLELKQLAAVLAELRAAIAGDANAVPNVLSILDDLARGVRNLPGDAFFIGHIVASDARGFVAYLRLVRELRTDALATRPADVQRGASARRIAKLKSPYLYRLTQQLASVFSDIGLPADYESHRQALANEIRSNVDGKSLKEASK